MMAAMNPATEPLQRVGVRADALADFARRHGLRELAIFGSVLRDDFRDDSDVDILFDLQPGDTLTLEKFLAMKEELESLFGRNVDLVEKPLVTNPYRRAEILPTRRVLYAA
jgi:predicted nucleotidyltransferase